MKNLKLELARISAILGNPNVIHCDCGLSYVPMDQVTLHLCPNCKQNEILDLDEDCREFEFVGVEE